MVIQTKAVVTDWVSQNIQHSGIRVAVTALSYLDTQSYHPEIIVTTLKYFNMLRLAYLYKVAMSMFYNSIGFELEANQHVVLKNRRQYG